MCKNNNQTKPKTTPNPPKIKKNPTKQFFLTPPPKKKTPINKKQKNSQVFSKQEADGFRH